MADTRTATDFASSVAVPDLAPPAQPSRSRTDRAFIVAIGHPHRSEWEQAGLVARPLAQGYLGANCSKALR